MPGEILAFHFMLFSRLHVWKENFEAPLTSLTRVIMPSLFGYTLLLCAVYLVSRGIWQRHENAVARWLTESAITPRILARTCRTVPAVVSPLHARRAETGCRFKRCTCLIRIGTASFRALARGCERVRQSPFFSRILEEPTRKSRVSIAREERSRKKNTQFLFYITISRRVECYLK